jgi:iron(III) transport system permease protein
MSIARMFTTGSRAARAVPWTLLTIFIVGAFVVPLVTLIAMAFRTALPGLPGEWSLDGFVTAFTNTDIVKPLGDSLVFATLSATGGTVLALFFVFIATRTTVRLRRLVTPVMIVILATPALFFALSWAMLGADKVGLINKIYGVVSGSDGSIFTINSWFGLIAVMSIKLSSFAYFLLLGPSMQMNRSLEEASEVFGAGRLGTFFRIYIPLLSPAIIGSFLIAFIGSLQAFDTPQIIGTQAGIRVLATEIYQFVSIYPANYAAAACMALALVALLALLVFVQMKLLKGRSYTTVGGKSTFGAAWSFPRTGWLLNVAIVVFAMLAFVLPTVQLVLSSFNTVFGRYDGLSLRNYEKLFADPNVMVAVGNTLQFMIVGGFVTVLLGSVLTYALRFRPTRWKRALEIPTWIPWATPGLVGALAILGTILAVPALHPIYGTSWSMLLALVIACLPIAMRFTESAVLQIDAQLIDAARIAGAAPARSFTSILIPLIAPSFISGWFVTGLAIAGNLEVPLLLGSTQSTTIAGLAYIYFSGSATPLAAAVFCLLLVAVVALFGLTSAAQYVLKRALGRTLAKRTEQHAAATAKAAVSTQQTDPVLG